MRVRLARIEQAAVGIKTFWFETNHMPQYRAGQFTQLFLPHRPVDDRGTKRWFTLSSSPAEDMLAISTKFSPENGGSFKAAMAALKPGTALDLAYPMGDFVLPKDMSRPVVMVAGGIGVTPFRSMVRTAMLNQHSRKITLLYAANTFEELAFLDIFQKADITFVPIVSKASKGWKGETGLLTAARIIEHAGDEALIYLSGPDQMVRSLSDKLKGEGVGRRRIVTDYFPGYGGI